MKTKITYITTTVLVLLAALFALLNSYVWEGFSYFTLACFALLSLFWCGWLIAEFFTTYKRDLEERFKIYKAERVNSSSVSSTDFDRSEAAYKKEFNKKVRFEKVTKWLYIIFAFACAVTFVVTMFFV